MRRSFGVGALVALGLLLIYIAVVRPPQHIGWQLFLIVFGGLVLWGGSAMWRASQIALVLTEETLATETGEVIATVENIRSADRSFFAFKPSNGFLLRLKTPGSRAWSPGIWWRLGKSVGVGGVTHAPDAKYMAEVLTALIAERDSKS